MPIAVDFETYYDKEYSLRKMSTWNYVYDDRFDAYLVAVYGEGIEFVGHPSTFDWSQLNGKELLAHNAYFDSLVFRRLQEDGKIAKDVIPTRWMCTADMVVFLRAPRNLAGACKQLLGIDIDKETRDKMKGLTYEEAVALGMEKEIHEYGIRDARYSWMLFDKFGDEWPDTERRLSESIRWGCLHGVCIDTEYLDGCIQKLETLLLETLDNLPWVDRGLAPLSTKGLREQGRLDGIPVPASTAKTDEAAIAWFKEYSKSHPWVAAYRDYRGINTHLKRFQAVRNLTRADNTMPFQILYHGTHPGRPAAGSAESQGQKFNMLNMPRKALFGCDLRKVLCARPGHKLVVADLDQIEAIVLLWRAGDMAMLEEVVREGNLYQAYARRRGWFTGTDLKKEDNDMYQRTKVAVLQLGYGSWWPKFQHIASVNYGVEFSDEEAEKVVVAYRDDNPLIVNFWDEHQRFFTWSATHDDPTHIIELASGRNLTYFNPKARPSQKRRGLELMARTWRGGKVEFFYGGKLTENEIQATSRDILLDGRLAALDRGIPILWDVYDELVAEVPEGLAEEAAHDLVECMTKSSPWAEGCPIGASVDIVDHYFK